MRKIWIVGVVAGIFAGPVAGAQVNPANGPVAASAAAQGADSAPPMDDWGKLVAANNLDAKGNSPFHLGMSFQLYDLTGKPTETGSFESWWPGVGRIRSFVKLAGLNEDGSAPDGADAATVRNAYLVSQLMESAIHPVPIVRSPAEMVTKPFTYGKIKLQCTGPKPTPSEAMNAQPATVCTAPSTADVLLLQGLGGELQMLRPKTGKFRDTFVPFELRIYYVGIEAIEGKMTIMQASHSETLQADTSAETTSDRKVVRVLGAVIQGHRTKSVQPNYPAAAKMSHLSGVVLLYAVIGKDGTVQRLIPIASTTSMFTEAATEAVRQWRYSPYLLNGEPTEVDTTINVNFAIN